MTTMDAAPRIRWKLYGWLLGLGMVLVLVMALLLTLSAQGLYGHAKERQLQRALTSVSDAARLGGWDALETRSRRGDGIFLEVWQGGERLWAFGNETNGVHPRMDAVDAAAIIDREAGTVVTRMQTDTGDGQARDAILATMRAYGAQGEPYAVMGSVLLTPDDVTRPLLLWLPLVAAGILMVCCALLALPLSAHLARPVRRLQSTSAHYLQGKGGVVIRGDGYRETEQLAVLVTATADRLSQMEDYRKGLVSGVSHDLQAPLSLIVRYSEMLRDATERPPQESVQALVAECDRLSALLGSLAELSRLQAGGETLALAPFDMAALAREMVELVASLYGPQGVRIHAIQPEKAMLVQGDRERIAQLLYIYLLNAVAHAKGDGERTITVRLSRESDRAQVDVSDNGDALGREAMRTVWESYFSVDVQTREPMEGAGLALTVARSILERHPDIRYGVRSAQGSGVTFWFSLRLAGVSS